jgi:hypothetical protein
MSTKGIEAVLIRAMGDPKFMDDLFTNPAAVLAQFDLTTEEKNTFKNMTRSEFTTLTQASPEERRSFWMILNQG